MPTPSVSLTDADMRRAADLIAPQVDAHRTVYLAIIEQMDGTYDVEAEVNSGTIATTLATESADVSIARAAADALEAVLRARQIQVAPTREAWEQVLDNQAIA